MPNVLSLFSGVGGFDLGLEAAGWRTVFFCEWDKHAKKVLERRWPDVPKWDDVSTLTAEHILSVAPIVDVVAWGSPCQDLSVAGRRAGLQGERSGLFHQGVRIIKEMREATNGKYPRVSLWENVVGALSSRGGADFGEVLHEMDEIGACFSEWRVLDAQYFGVPQRRRRVFLVSVFDPATAARCPDPLLPVEEGVRGDTSQGTTTRESVTRKVAASVADSSEHQRIVGPVTTHMGSPRGTETSDSEHLVVEAFTGSSHAQYTEGVGTLRANGGDLGGGSETLLLDGTRVNDVRVYEAPVQTLKSRMGTGGNNVPVVAVAESTMLVRRLTPLECERLMGWPDGHTDGQADTHRYKQCGNGVASPVAEWLARCIGPHL